MLVSQQVQQTHDAQIGEALREIQRRLVSIHYELAEGPPGDRELQRRARERLMELMTYVNDAIGATMTNHV
jgi:cob(I)alamin adenosyltransferase